MNSQHLVQQNFNRAATNYLTHATMQRTVAHELIKHTQAYINSETQVILDLGSGPGTFSHSDQQPKNPIIAIDLSLNMLKTSSHSTKINADATKLPLSADSIDIIISNLMLQWPPNKQAAFNEISRVLKPTGKAIFTTLVTPSLNELISGWAQLDNAQHTLKFLNTQNYTQLAEKAQLRLIKQNNWHEKLFFKDLFSLFKHFSQTGTNLPKTTGQGLGGKTRLKQLELIYPREDRGFPLSYYYLIQCYSKE